MAGIENYSNQLYDNQNQLDSMSHLQFIQDKSTSESKYKYINSDPDFENRSIPVICSNVEDEISIQRYLGASVSLVSLITENLLCHPFVVLRRQCQVHHTSNKYHLQPFTLLPSIIHLHQRQGLTTLWKGLGSCLLVRGMTLATEDVVSKVTLWPKEINDRASLKQFGQHILLKCMSIGLVIPFYAASLVETVQSDIASEKPGIFDVFYDGANRLLYWRIPQKGRMLPIWALIAPSVSLGITKYIFGLIVKGISSKIMYYKWKGSQNQKGAKYRDGTTHIQNIEIYSTLLSIISSEIVFYPFETVLHRLQLQGTRTIIDNLDNGISVVPILTSYEGAIDCCKTTIATEGITGVYKGFGALLLQFTANIAVIKLTKWIVSQIAEIVTTKPSTSVVEYYNLERTDQSNSTTISPSLSSLNGAE